MALSIDSPLELLKKQQTRAIASKTSKLTTTASPRTPAKRPKTEDSGDPISTGGPPRKKVARKTGLVS